MAVYTIIEADVMASLLTPYSIGELISLERISNGVENTNYRLRTTSGRFIVTIYEDRVNTDDLPYFLSVKQNLAQSSLLVPKPIGNKSGQVVFEFGNKFGAIFSHLNGHEVQAIGKDECFLVGETLAKIHSAKMPNALNRPNNMGPDNWVEM
ncbi:phosphotransferase [Candidatus Halocynthiibacter alkanivorans]|uniref:phosphotransferase n=1 Tax=Candidatus Halocynthiibacter alkanivorans TaxID=2267619 RepID=UPI000DF128CC|nr:phosphotransferase [Candidatus Halocynthiibacter alkanivorans]